MNYLSALLGSASFFFTALLATPVLADSVSNATPQSGRVSFVYDDGQSQCSVDATPQMFEISYYAGGPGIRPCEHNRVRYIRLDGVRSAVTIRLWSYLRSGRPGGCQPGEAHNFTFYLRTIKNPTTTQLIELKNLKDIKENEPIQPGITLTKKIITDENKIDKLLSCVEIIYD